MTTDKKLYIAVAALAVLGGVAFWNNKKQEQDLAAHSLESAAESLPKVALGDEDIKKIDKIEIDRPADGDGGVAETIILVKKGEDNWALEKPTAAKATESNVKSLLDNLKRLEVSEEIAPSKEAHAKYDLTDDKALHAVFYKGAQKALDLYFGENGSRGQMTRVAGKDNVYAIKGYSSFLYSRDAKGWRDKEIFKFEEKDVVKVSVENENGTFTFDKKGEEWTANHAKKKGPAKALEKFDKTKLESLIRAYKTLAASDFGDGKSLADVGLDAPAATVTLEMKEGSGRHVLTVGKTAEGSNRWAKKNGSDQIFSISSWSADWATGNAEKFQKTDDKKAGADDKGPDDGPPGDMPPIDMEAMKAAHGGM